MHVLAKGLARLTISAMITSAVAMNAQAACTPGVACQETGHADLQSVSEILNVPADGATNVLHLKQAPSMKSSLRLFRNRVELNSQLDYTVQGNLINLTGQTPRSPGDEYEAQYAIDVPMERVGVPPATSNLQEHNREAIAAYLQRSLDESLSTNMLQREVRRQSKGDSPISRRSKTIPDLRSMRMLAAAMSDRTTTGRRSTGESPPLRGATGPAQGLEGLGDQSFNGPFDLLGGTPGTLAQAIATIDAHASADRGVNYSRDQQTQTMRSLKMLERRLSISTSR